MEHRWNHNSSTKAVCWKLSIPKSQCWAWTLTLVPDTEEFPSHSWKMAQQPRVSHYSMLHFCLFYKISPELRIAQQKLQSCERETQQRGLEVPEEKLPGITLSQESCRYPGAGATSSSIRTLSQVGGAGKVKAKLPEEGSTTGILSPSSPAQEKIRVMEERKENTPKL